MPEPEEEAADEDRGRPFWSGVLSFGLVSIPVDLLAAQRSARGSLRMLDADGTPLARRYYCPADCEELEPEQLVRGYELESGKIVVVTDEELEALAPKQSREIDLRLFVEREELDPLYFDRSYFLAPGAGSGKAYRLLTAVMERSERAGIATFVMRDRQYLIAIFAEGGLLRAQTLRFAAQVRSSEDIGLPAPAQPERRVVERIARAVKSLEQKRWDGSELTDPREAVRELAERKYRKGKDVVAVTSAEPEEKGTEVVDLMEVLRQSLAANDLASKTSRQRSKRAPARSRSRSGKSSRRPSATRAAEARGKRASGAKRASSKRQAKTTSPKQGRGGQQRARRSSARRSKTRAGGAKAESASSA